MWDRKVKLTDTDNSMVVTRGKGGLEDSKGLGLGLVKGKGDQIYDVAR